MQSTNLSIRDLALSPLAGFRHIETTVPEWGGVKVILREPSADAWQRWREIVDIKKVLADESNNEITPEPTPEDARVSLKADVTLFIDVLFGLDKKPVFDIENADQIESLYGPVHSRLLKKALDLTTTPEEAKKK